MLGKVLGPRGLMPNPETDTVTDDTAKTVKEDKAGRVGFKVYKTSNVHVAIDKASFTGEQITDQRPAANMTKINTVNWKQENNTK